MVDLSNDSNWQLIAEEQRNISGTPGYFNKIPNIIMPIPFINEYFKVFANTVNGKSTWNYAGRLYLYIGSVNDFAPEYFSSTGIILNEWRIVHFPGVLLTQQSHLSFEPPYWMPDIDLEVYQYQEV
ncbi:MAG: hypothetical protein WBA93_36765 [Microcoleaceae cyanobacterium]